MMQINLLPWRQQARHINKMRFAFCSAIAGVLSLLIIVMMYRNIALILDQQQARNDFIQAEINNEQAVLAASTKEMDQHLAYEAKIRSMVNIKKENYNAVQLLNVLPIISMSSILITEISRAGNLITITGKANSSAEVTAFMNNIQNQETIFNEPSLANISSEHGNSKDVGYFELKIVQKDMA